MERDRAGVLVNNSYYFNFLRPEIPTQNPRIDHCRLAYCMANGGNFDQAPLWKLLNGIDPVFLRTEHSTSDKEKTARGFLEILEHQGWRIVTVKRGPNAAEECNRRIVNQIAEWTRDSSISTIGLAVYFPHFIAQTRTAQSRGKTVRVLVPESLFDSHDLSRAALSQSAILFSAIKDFITRP